MKRAELKRLQDIAEDADKARKLLGPEAEHRPLVESVERLLGLLEASRAEVRRLAEGGPS